MESLNLQIILLVPSTLQESFLYTFFNRLILNKADIAKVDIKHQSINLNKASLLLIKKITEITCIKLCRYIFLFTMKHNYLVLEMSNKIIKWSVFIGSFYKILVEEEKEGRRHWSVAGETKVHLE